MLENIFDSHAHYDDERFNEDRNEILSSLPAKGISHIVNAGCDIKSSETGIILSERHAFVYCAVGTHPHSAAEMQDGYIEHYKKLAQNKKVVAIGEIGLDYHYDFSPREAQVKVFEQQLELAKQLNLPVIIHSREATQQTLDILKKHRPFGVVHCFTGAPEVAEEYLKLGMFIGFSGAVTFKNAKKVAAAAKLVPLDKMLIETDCPYMSPEPFRGRRCDSSLIEYTAGRLAEIKGLTPQQIIDHTCNNAKKLFGIL
ncbi:MAG TPA: hydrolase TatD [Ruminococcaceae bacterium]|nr:hydrolase TatD [Oscillospiraceae bacterium]